jgi:hypothetical protein
MGKAGLRSAIPQPRGTVNEKERRRGNHLAHDAFARDEYFLGSQTNPGARPGNKKYVS